MVKLQLTSKGQYFLTLPKALVEAKQWEKGKELTITFDEKGNMEIREK